MIKRPQGHGWATTPFCYLPFPSGLWAHTHNWSGSEALGPGLELCRQPRGTHRLNHRVTGWPFLRGSDLLQVCTLLPKVPFFHETERHPNRVLSPWPAPALSLGEVTACVWCPVHQEPGRTDQDAPRESRVTTVPPLPHSLLVTLNKPFSAAVFIPNETLYFPTQPRGSLTWLRGSLYTLLSVHPGATPISETRTELPLL